MVVWEINQVCVGGDQGGVCCGAIGWNKKLAG